MSDIGQWLRNNSILSKDSLRFITSIKYDASLMKALNNMTFFYDVNWQGDGKTLPIGFFYIKDYSEIMSSEVSQKTMLFYNSGTTTPDATKGGLLGVVADNIVNKPKKYKLEVIVPASFTMIDKIYQFDSYTRNMMFLQQTTSLNEEGAIPTLATAISAFSTNIVAGLLQALLAALNVESLFTTDIITQLLTLDTANKDSLSAMWGNRTIIKFKVPNGWKFKYVAIENMNINKKGEDGDYFTGTIEVTEIPILTIDKGRKFAPLQNVSRRLRQTSLTIIDTIVNRMEKAFD